jgi:beta-glucosidase-like glycosyl hydrolase
MPRERRLQADARLGERDRKAASPGVSPWLVIGIVALAASLVAIGAIVILGSLGGDRGNTGQSPLPPRTPGPQATSRVVTIGRQDPSSDPAATPNTPGIATPASSGAGQPIFSPQPPVEATAPASAPGPDGAQATPATQSGAAQPTAGTAPESSPASSTSPAAASDPDVERALARLQTDEDKVGQLLLLAWIGSTAEQARPALTELRAGGIVFVQNTSSSAEAKTINAGLLQIARDAYLTPPLTAIDHEGGIVQRIKDVENLGNNWDFAAQRPTDAAACQRGLTHANQLRGMGFSMNLAPVLDVNNNPANPVIGKRSYSDDPGVVARLGAAYIRGLQGGGVAAVGKHFPGHGNTSVDSHLGLPSLPQTVADLEQIELVPFRAAVQADIAGIMSAHIVFPAVDRSGDPATLSRAVMTDLLRGKLNFKGLAVSDDMGGMKAITDNYPAGAAAVQAIKAGVDMIILSTDIGGQRVSRDALLAAVRSGEISRDRLDQAVRNVLQVKARFGVLTGTPPPGRGCL